MPITMGKLRPFGLRQVMVRAYGSGGAKTPFPVAQSFKVTPETVSGKLEGDDTRQSLVGYVVGGTIQMVAGGISLDALQAVSGFASVPSGTTPSRTTALPVSNAPFPYVEMWGRSVGDTGDDMYVHIFKAKLVKFPEGELKFGQFFVQTMEFDFICDDTQNDANGNPQAFDIVQDETAAAIPT